MKRLATVLTMLLSVILALAGATAAQAIDPPGEVEPNNTCQTAQDLGTLDAPLSIAGSITEASYPAPDGTELDTDYFRITGTPKALASVSIYASASGEGTLGAMVITIQRSNCQETNFYYGGGAEPDPKDILFPFPDDGVLNISIFVNTTNLPAGTTVGGTYRLALAKLPPAGPILGKVLDSATGLPPEGATVGLSYCWESYCYPWSSAPPDPIDGSFRFDTSNTLDMMPQDYQVSVYFPDAEGVVLGRRFVSSGEIWDLGLNYVTPPPPPTPINSISGRFVDAISGKAVKGISEANGYATLTRCGEFGCYEGGWYAKLTPNGRFVFSNDGSQAPIYAGDYQLGIILDQYASVWLNFSVQGGEQRDLGDILVEPWEVQIFDAKGCADIPASGGQCSYSARIVNGTTKRIRLKAWSVINTPSTWFQPDPASTLSLKAGEGKTLAFKIYVPRNAPAGTSFCGTVFVMPNEKGFYFSQQKNRQTIFCAAKDVNGVTRALPAKEAQELAARLTGVGAGDGSAVEKERR